MKSNVAEIHTAVVDAEGNVRSGDAVAIVPWWSFTKTLIAACALRLAQEGRLALDLPVAALPYTPRDLLQHRAGVGNYGGIVSYHEAVARGGDPWSHEELFRRVPPDAILFPPRGGWAYSNVGYLIVRRLIEEACGVGLNEVLRVLVLEPLGLSTPRLAEAREDMRSTAFQGGQNYHPGWAFHGILIGSATDAALALHRLLHSDVLTPASRACLLERNPVGGALAGRPWLTTGYGLGLAMGKMYRDGMAKPLEVVGHSAAGPGSVAAVYQASAKGRCRTAAVFVGESDEAVAEIEALRLLSES